MFSFLNAGFLVAAAAALIPLIIHLFSKRKVKLIEFSSLKHLIAMQRRQVRRLKIRQLLLLILRMLIILIVVLAFAEPTTTGGNIGSHASVSAVIIFDNSASMNRYVKDGNLFDLTKDKAIELMQSFGEGDQIAIVSSGISSSESGKIEFSSPAAAKEKIRLIAPGYGPTKLESGLRSALELLVKAINLNKEIYILSDLQRNSLPEEQLIDDSSVSLYFVVLAIGESDNLTVSGVSLGGKLLIPGKPFEITATIKNQGGRNHDDVIASLFVNGSRVSQTSVKIAAGKETVSGTPSSATQSVSRRPTRVRSSSAGHARAHGLPCLRESDVEDHGEVIASDVGADATIDDGDSLAQKGMVERNAQKRIRRRPCRLDTETAAAVPQAG
ncbi:MAG: BatA domain-containing protein [candidate division Zixibacteria bacterium]|nr:BatA domain-containing protein [candidate division Zixibacteria bacterium]